VAADGVDSVSRPPGVGAKRVAVVGAGWAGLAAAVEATEHGHEVTLFDMAHHAGGRARTLALDGLPLDNGQHILIGAYRETLALMRRVGVEPEQVLHRQALSLRAPDGSGLRLPPGAPVPAFVRGVLAWQDVPLADRLRLLWLAARWRLQGFQCNPSLSVRELAHDCPKSVFDALLDPLCVAALNTPAAKASGQVLLTVLHDALFGGRGGSDLLLPRAPLDALLPAPAMAWLIDHGAAWRPGHRVQALQRFGGPHERSGWQVDGERFDHVVLACTAAESARLLAEHAPTWSAVAANLRYEPIVTVWLRAPAGHWPQPMLAFPARDGDDAAPAQFGFSLGQLGGPDGVYALVISGAGAWVEKGLAVAAGAVMVQWDAAFGAAVPAELITVRAEKRATFACVPGLSRPGARPLPGVSVAGDHVAGPYPATLEGAVRSGLAAVRDL
jgi:hydroxysqualene dehydroxylase